MAEIVPITQGKRKGKIPINEVYSQIAQTLIGGPAANRRGFERDFRVYEPAIGIREVVIVDEDDVATVIPPEAVVSEIACYGQSMKHALPEYCLSHAQSTEAMKLWRYLAKPIERPASVRWKNEPGVTFRRLPWDFVPTESLVNAPTFIEMMGRCSNSDALMIWIGSLFDPESDRQQYVWIHGKGDDSKSALARLLAKAFGRASSAQSVPHHHGDKFWTYGLLDKRFVYFPDCNKDRYPASGEFKQLTGDDMVRIEPKGGAPYSAQLCAKFLFLSNEKPSLSSERADLRRVIYCEMQHMGGNPDPAYEARLWEEGGAFLSFCITRYESAGRGRIRVDTDEINEWIATVEEDFESFFELNFELDIERLGVGGYSEEQKRLWVKPADFQERLVRRFKSKPERLAFGAWLERVHGVKRTKVKLGAGTAWRYARIKMLPVAGAVPLYVPVSEPSSRYQND